MKNLLFLTLLVTARFSTAQDYSMSDLSITPPLTPMSGGDYAMERLGIGEPERSLAGGDFTMEIIVTPLPPVVVLGDAEVFIAIAGGAAVVTWTSPGGGFILESSTSLGATANWQPVVPAPTETRFVSALQGAPQFFRLRKP